MAPSRKTEFLLGIIALGVWVIAAGEMRGLLVPDAQAQLRDGPAMIYGCSREYGDCVARPVAVDKQGYLLTRARIEK